MADLVAQQINNDPLLQHVMKDVDGQRKPVLGNIPLLAKIGEGVSGAVYRAVHPTLNRDVAVKVMLFPDEKSIRFQRFMTHAKSAMKVKSKRLAQVLDANTEAGLVYIVSEFVDGISAEKHLQKLKERLKPGLPETALLNLAISTVEALAAAHNENVVHLDIRPSCLLIPKTASGDLAFSDARLTDLGQAYNEFIGRFLIGTAAETGMPGFMSPEQAMGVESPGKPSDIFSFGASMYALLVGQSPYGGLTIDNVISATLHQPIGDVRTWRPDVSRATSKIVEICLRKHPAARFSDARVLLQALQISLDSLDCGIDIQQAAVEEIEALVKSASSAELPAARIMPVSEALTDQLAQAAASHVTLPVLPPAPSSANAPANSEPAAVAPVTHAAAPKPADPASEPTIMTSMQTQLPKKATELFSKSASTASAPAVIPVKSSPRTNAVPIQPSNPNPNRPVTKVVPIKPAGSQSEWVDPTVKAEETGETEAPKKSSAGILVAALLLVAVGAGAWKMGYLPIGKKPLVAQTKTGAPAVNPAVKSDDPAAKAKAEADKAAAAAKLKTEEEAKVAADKAKAEAEKATTAAKAKADEDERLKKEKAAEEARLAKQKEEAEAAALKAKAAEDERLKKEKEAELVKLKAEEDAKVAAALKARADEERLAREAEAAKTAALAKQKEEEEARRVAALKAKADEERAAKEAEAAKLAIAAKQKEEEEAKRAAALKTKAEEERAAKDAEAARLAKLKAEEDARAAAALKAKSEQPVAQARTATGPLAKDVVVKLGGSTDIDFVLVPGGTFNMGTDRAVLSEIARNAGAVESDFADEVPAHKVEVGAFYISKTPVTVAQYRTFVEATGYKTSAEKAGAAFVLRDRQWRTVPGACWSKPGFSQRDDHPVVLLSWRDCDAFAKWAAKVTGHPVRLPTEAEWEYAARGASSNTYPWGNAWDGRMANHGDRRLQPHAPQDWYTSKFDDGFPFTSPVEKFVNASWCGALDMAGNVWQWCADAYEPYPQSSSAPRILEDSSEVPADAKRVLRGGSWLLRGFECRSAARRGASPRSASCEFGLRLAFTQPASK